MSKLIRSAGCFPMLKSDLSSTKGCITLIEGSSVIQMHQLTKKEGTVPVESDSAVSRVPANKCSGVDFEYARRFSMLRTDVNYSLELSAIINFLANRREPGQALRIIDCGCLDDTVIAEIAERFGKQHKLDLYCLDERTTSLQASDILPAENIFEVDLLSDSMSKLPAQHFDLILLTNVFSGADAEILQNLPALLFPQLLNILAPGGLCLLGLDYCEIPQEKVSELNSQGLVFEPIRFDNWLLARAEATEREPYLDLVKQARSEFERLSAEKLAQLREYLSTVS